MQIMKISELPLDEILREAVDILLAGGVIAYPTETFYALGVKFDRDESLERLYTLKKRPREKALPLIIGSTEMLSDLSPPIGSTVRSLMDTFWPGPLTLVLPALSVLPDNITAGTHTIAVRIPGKSFALRLAQAARFPITATSANTSGSPPAADAQTVTEYFNATLDLIVDGGITPGGSPSTIVDVTGERALILREGAIKREHMAAYLMPG